MEKKNEELRSTVPNCTQNGCQWYPTACERCGFQSSVFEERMVLLQTYGLSSKGKGKKKTKYLKLPKREKLL